MSIAPTHETTDASPVEPWRFSEGLSRKFLPRLDAGTLKIVFPGGHRTTIRGPAPGPEATLVILRWRTLRRLLTGGDIGFAEAYMDGDWSSPNLPTLIALFAQNQSAIESADAGSWFARTLSRLHHRSRANSIPGSRKNIVQHYDLGNEFYSHWLDRGMSYSSALFETPEITLAAAQTAKQERVLTMLGLRPGHSVLEIGFGWGGLAEHMAAAGAYVTGLTLSPAQHSYASRRLHEAGLTARSDLQLRDYRNAVGTYDHVVSIEMIEAVGEEYWPVYFDTLRSRLRSGGSIVLQAITIADARFSAYRSGVDFIQRYIFPGGVLPSPSTLQQAITRAGLRTTEVLYFGESYAETLRHWRERFLSNWPAIEELGFSQRFKRMWDYYLAYSEGGFRAGAIDVGLWRLEHAQ